MTTTKTITATEWEKVVTDETGGKYLHVLVTYDDATQDRLVFPLFMAVPQ